MEENILSLLPDFFLTFIIYDAVPLILRFILKKQYTEKKALKIAIINSVVIWFIFLFLYVCFEMDGTPKITAAWIWGIVAYYLLRKKTKVKIEDDSETDVLIENLKNKNATIHCEVCGKEIPYNENGTCEECHEIIMSRLKENKNDNKELHETKEKLFCTNCGNEIEDDWKFCNHCGHQLKLEENEEKENLDIELLNNDIEKSKANGKETKINSSSYSKRFFITFVTIIIIISCAINYFIYMNMNDKYVSEQKENENLIAERNNNAKIMEKLQDQNKQLKDETKEYTLNDSLKVSFMDKYVVIVPNNTNIYHKYDCQYFDKINTDSILIFNVDNAEYEGYVACKNCIK